MQVTDTASLPLMVAPISDVVTTFEVVQAVAIDPITLRRTYGLFVFDFLEVRNFFLIRSPLKMIDGDFCIRVEICYVIAVVDEKKQ